MILVRPGISGIESKICSTEIALWFILFFFMKKGATYTLRDWICFPFEENWICVTQVCNTTKIRSYYYAPSNRLKTTKKIIKQKIFLLTSVKQVPAKLRFTTKEAATFYPSDEKYSTRDCLQCCWFFGSSICRWFPVPAS